MVKTENIELKNSSGVKREEAKDRDRVHDVSEILESFGPYHYVQYFLACLPSMFVTMININYVFVAGDLDYRCRIPECEDLSSTSQLPAWWPNTTVDRCQKPLLMDGFNDNDTCSAVSFTGALGKCDQWIYESNNTIIGELNLACEPWKTNLIGTVHNIGMIFSMLIAGWLSDKFGRKPTVIFCAVASCIGNVKTFVTGYYMYIAVEFFESFICGGIYPATSVMLIEIGGKKNRVLAGVLFAYVIYFGELIFALVAMYVPYWKTLIRIIYTPSILFLSYIIIINESPRWQILNGKTDEAKKTLEKIADMNNVNINKQELMNLDESQLKKKFNIDKYEVKEGYKNIFTSVEIVKRLLVASVCRFTCGFVYYGLVINSVLLPGNKYTNFLLSTVMSFPGELIALYLMNRVGRKLPLIIGYLLAGIACVASSYAPTTWARIAFYLIGKMVISACFTGIVTYTMEIYPTSTRGTLLGFGAFASRSGAMLAPLTPMLLQTVTYGLKSSSYLATRCLRELADLHGSDYPLAAQVLTSNTYVDDILTGANSLSGAMETSIFEPLPTILFGGFALLSGALMTLTPETKDLPLFDTIAQVEASTKQNNNDNNMQSTETIDTQLSA